MVFNGPFLIGISVPFSSTVLNVYASVGDPDPVQDPLFRPPGSGSISQILSFLISVLSGPK
jgi:hypothetical protein